MSIPKRFKRKPHTVQVFTKGKKHSFDGYTMWLSCPTTVKICYEYRMICNHKKQTARQRFVAFQKFSLKHLQNSFYGRGIFGFDIETGGLNQNGRFLNFDSKTAEEITKQSKKMLRETLKHFGELSHPDKFDEIPNAENFKNQKEYSHIFDDGIDVDFLSLYRKNKVSKELIENSIKHLHELRLTYKGSTMRELKQKRLVP